MSNPAPEAPKPDTTPTPTPETDWKAESRKWEARAKENSDASAKLAAMDEAAKSDLQKAQDAKTAAEAERDALRQEKQVAQWVAEIAKASGVPAEALRGSTQDELQAHADQLKTLIAPPDAPGTPKGAIGPYVPMEGTTPSTPVQSPGDIFASFLKAQQG